MILVVDNFDSFTYNLVQCLGELGATLVVRRNNQITPDEVAAMQPAGIVISPGPGRPEDAGPTIAIIQRFGSSIPILGVCLGHQAIAVAFGGAVVRARLPVHGKTSTVNHDGQGVFAGVATPIQVGRYHSLVVSEPELPPELEVSARTQDDRIVMGLRHVRWPVHGVQFHPESILTRHGPGILANFVRLGSEADR